MSSPAAVELCRHYCELFANLTPNTIEQFRECVSPHIHFRDPFNDVHSFDEMRAILEEMFEHTQGPAFQIVEQSVFDEHAWLRWHFQATLPVVGELFVEGATRLCFDLQEGVVTEHIDYWDSAPVYMRLPVVGKVLRYVRKRMALKS